jgi:hypothetical protein
MEGDDGILVDSVLEDRDMQLPSERVEHDSRVDEHVRALAERIRNPRLLAGVVAGTSEETAALFNSGRTLAEDETGPRDED